MKKLLFVLSIGLLFFSCEKDEKEEVKPKSEACFNYIPDNDVKIGDTIKFTSCSQNATTYKWDFGDGKIATDSIAKHVYKTSGTYKLRLYVYNEFSSDTIEKTISIRDYTKFELLTSTIWSAYLLQDASTRIQIPNNETQYLYLNFLKNGTIEMKIKSVNGEESSTGKWSLNETSITVQANEDKEIGNIKELTDHSLKFEILGVTISLKPKN